MPKKRLYRVIFTNQGKVYELYAKQVAQGTLYGFIEIQGIVFGERSGVVVDPTEERLRAEFEGVARAHVPVHSVVRVDEVEKQGPARIVPLSGKGDPPAVAGGAPTIDPFIKKRDGN